MDQVFRTSSHGISVTARVAARLIEQIEDAEERKAFREIMVFVTGVERFVSYLSVQVEYGMLTNYSHRNPSCSDKTF